jgi:3-oxoadipate enol-lactonase
MTARRITRTTSIPVADGALECETAGEGPAVVLIHGGLVDRRLWDGQVGPLARDHRVIRYDLRGLGRSSMPGGPFSHLDDLDQVLNALAVDRAVLIGLSLGGMIAMDYTLEHPERVRALVLAAPGLRGYEWDPNPAMEEVYLTLLVDPERAIALLLKTGMGGATAEAKAALERMVTDNLRGWSQVDPKSVRWPSTATLDRLGDIQAPTLVLIGSDDEPALRQIAETIASTIPQASQVVVSGARHHLNLDRPGEFRRKVRRFLEGLEGPV